MNAFKILVVSVAITCAIFIFSLMKFGERSLGTLETIHGIPYPMSDGATVILEDMAHADLFLREPVLAKQAKFTVSFDPKNSESIDLGIRENEFWLSYKKYPLYRKGIDVPTLQTKEITIPLTTALQDTDRSVDLMFFTDNNGSAPEWRIQTFRASLEFDMPSVAETKAYVKSIITRERAL